jgi:hypothetical protein
VSWRVARSLTKLFEQVNDAYPKRSKLSDGTIGDAAHAARTSDHNPNSAGVVTAADITHDPKHGMDVDVLVKGIIQSRDNRVKYIIRNRKIMSGNDGPSAWKWREYDGSNPHTKHVHISVETSKSLYDNTKSWRLKPTGNKPTKPSGDYEDYNKKADPGDRTLKLYSAGDDVAFVQRFIGRHDDDGYFGPITEKDVKWYQDMRGLTADGIVGNKTWNEML